MTFTESYGKLKAKLRDGEYLSISAFTVSRPSVEESGKTRQYGGTLFHDGLGQGFSLYPRSYANCFDSPGRKKAYLKLVDLVCTLRVLSNGRKYLMLADRMKDAGLRFAFFVTANRWNKESMSLSSRKIFAFSNLTRSESTTIAINSGRSFKSPARGARHNEKEGET